jgi:hypothetical protein
MRRPQSICFLAACLSIAFVLSLSSPARACGPNPSGFPSLLDKPCPSGNASVPGNDPTLLIAPIDQPDPSAGASGGKPGDQLVQPGPSVVTQIKNIFGGADRWITSNLDSDVGRDVGAFVVNPFMGVMNLAGTELVTEGRQEHNQTKQRLGAGATKAGYLGEGALEGTYGILKGIVGLVVNTGSTFGRSVAAAWSNNDGAGDRALDDWELVKAGKAVGGFVADGAETTGRVIEGLPIAAFGNTQPLLSALHDSKDVGLAKAGWSKVDQITDILTHGTDEQQNQLTRGAGNLGVQLGSFFVLPGGAALKGLKGAETLSDAGRAAGAADKLSIVADGERAVAGGRDLEAPGHVLAPNAAADGVRGGAPHETGNCFAAGTPVLTPEGERSIETIGIGDVVLSRDPETFDLEPHRVARTFVTPDREVVELDLESGSDVGHEHFVVTPGHPFYVEGRGFTHVVDLAPGDVVVTNAGTARVERLLALPQSTTVYNFEVETAHTYFVGRTGAWVHNDCVQPRPEAPIVEAATDTLLPADVLRAAHPGRQDALYHNTRHSLAVPKFADEFAKARGLPDEERLFIRQVALLHDWDPHRVPGTPPGVPQTIDALRADFEGKKPLVPGAGGSVLRNTFGWDEKKLKEALAMIQRTEFPFEAAHPNPAYGGSSPVARYEAMLRDLPPESRAFVMREGALLSEYADKMSTYSARGFGGALSAVNGLIREINLAAGARVTDARSLDTVSFLRSIGDKQNFAQDRRLARALGVKLVLPSRAQALSLLPEHAGQLQSNLAGFEAHARALAEGASLKDAARVGSSAAEFDATNAALVKGQPIFPPGVPEKVGALFVRGLAEDTLNVVTRRGFFSDGLRAATDAGFDAKLAPTNSVGLLEANANIVIKEVKQLISRGNETVVILCHSMGCNMASAALAKLKELGHEEILKKVRLVTYGAPYLGSPSADLMEGNLLGRMVGRAIATAAGGDRAVVSELKTQVRAAYIAEHPHPEEVPTLSIAWSAPPITSPLYGLSRALGPLYRRKGFRGPNDAMVPVESQILPNAKVLFLRGDHMTGAFGLPGARYDSGRTALAVIAMVLRLR